MRVRLLDATVACLVEYGYAGTTVTRIAEHAGVTRGAQVHHFRTKDDLVTAAVTHLAGQSAVFGWRQIARVADADDVVGELLDVLWTMHQGPTFTATVELWIAARTDGELSRHVAGVEPVLMAAVNAELDRSAGAPGFGRLDSGLRDAVFTAMDAMRGLTISIWHLPPRQRTARWRRARESLRLMFPADEQVRSAITAAASAN